MKALIIGFGSIGRRHYEVLSSFKNISNIDIVTKQILDEKQTFQNIEEIKNLSSYDYFIIASETKKHFEQLQFLESNTKDKIIFCEKPLFETKKEIQVLKNKVYVGYVLRFHPLFEKLKKFIKNDKILNANVGCGQYLPEWRPNVDYRDSYSAKKEEGGGVLLDLSHEIDYVQLLCGKINDIKSYQLKISDLEITSDDLTTFIGKTNNDVIVNISIDYISKIIYRRLHLNCLDVSYELDFIKNQLIAKDKHGIESIFQTPRPERNSMFKKMHQSILSNGIGVCTFKEGMDVMQTIYEIQEQNNE